MITVGNLVEVFEKTIASLHILFIEWDQIEDDLREHYARELEWLLRTLQSHLKDNLCNVEAQGFIQRAKIAGIELFKLGDDIDQKMGFRPESILDFGHPRP